MATLNGECLINAELNNKIITDILDRKILDLLKTIHSHYPDKFTKTNIQLEYNFIKNTIQFINNTSSNTKKYIITKKNSKPNSKPGTKPGTKPVSKITSTDRCCARIWNNIYERNTLKEVSDIDDKYKVKDFADIKIKSFNNQYIIGSQCKRKKTNGEKYCFQHKTHLPHGDYFDIPTKEICFHYLKECNYI
jgi:hypothetical protein